MQEDRQMRTTPVRPIVPLRYTLAATLALVAGFVDSSHAARLATPLTPTAAAPQGARGRAQVVMPAGKGAAKLLVLAHGLPPREAFEISADGMKIGTLRTNRGGNGIALFSSRSPGSRGRARLLGFDPRGVRLAIVDANGEEVLVGQLPGDSSGKIACCLAAAGDGAECARVTPTLCTLAGGTDTGQASCVPDPCVPPPADVVCCLPGSAEGAMVDAPVRCEEQLAPAACAQAGGAVIRASSCTPNPCESLPPPNEARCCLPDGIGFACKDRQPKECVDAGGHPVRAVSCDPNPCPPVQGACCAPSSAGRAFLWHDEKRECIDGLTPQGCGSAGGTFVLGAMCSDDPCDHPSPPPLLVACCLPDDDDDATCKVTTPLACMAARGKVTDSRSCRPDPCDHDDHDDDDGHHGGGGHGRGKGGHGKPPGRGAGPP
jgi:hypothetical protein